jgi:hypothetical protein
MEMIRSLRNYLGKGSVIPHSMAGKQYNRGWQETQWKAQQEQIVKDFKCLCLLKEHEYYPVCERVHGKFKYLKYNGHLYMLEGKLWQAVGGRLIITQEKNDVSMNIRG